MAVSGKYASDDTTEADRPLNAESGRKCVRNIQSYPILSTEWIVLVDQLKQLTRLVQLEGRMPANTRVSETLGRNTDSDGTLWDQEAHENAVRILVEEAKVNLCLRMMSDYKAWQYDAARRATSMREAQALYDLNEAQLEQKCKIFEESLGLLLMKAFQHVETLQLMDIPMLIEHLAVIFTRAQGCDSSGKTQEVLVTYYFSSLMKHAEALNNKELLAKTRELNIVHLAAHHLLQCPLGDVALAGAEGFASLADNEDFQTEWTTFFINEHGQLCPEKKARFNLLEENIVKVILENSPEKKRDLRPLTDFFNTLRRAYGEA